LYEEMCSVFIHEQCFVYKMKLLSNQNTGLILYVPLSYRLLGLKHWSWVEYTALIYVVHTTKQFGGVV